MSVSRTEKTWLLWNLFQPVYWSFKLDIQVEGEIAVDFARFPVNTNYLYNICTMLAQRQRRWADVVQMFYKCFVFAGLTSGLIQIVSKLFKGLECTVLPMALCTIKNPWSHSK